MIFDVLAGALALALAGGLAWRWRRLWPTWTAAERAAALLAAPGLFLFALHMVKSPPRMLGEDWNAARLAPSVAMTRGYAPYGSPDQGPILNMIYGPVTLLVYLPSAICSTPDRAVLAGGVITLLLFIPPLAGVFWAVGRTWKIQPGALFLGFLACFAALSLRRGSAYFYDKVHADAPALGFGLLACGLLLPRSGTPPGRGRTAAAALCAVRAVFSKQNSHPIPVALATNLALVAGRRSAGFFCAVAAASTLASGLLFSLLFGARDLWFNAIQVPGGHPWNEGIPAGLILLLDESYPAVLAFCVGALFCLAEWRRGAPVPWRDLLRREPWLPFALAAAFMLPTSLLGRIKAGGDDNSNHSVLYVTVAAAIVLLRPFSDPGGRFAPGLRGAALALALLTFAAGLRREREVLKPVPSDVLRDNPQRSAFEFVLRHPRQVWLANNPLVTLYADGRLYHFDYGVYDRILAGFSPTDRHLWDHLPENLTYTTMGQSRSINNRLLHTFTHKVRDLPPLLPPLFVRAKP